MRVRAVLLTLGLLVAFIAVSMFRQSRAFRRLARSRTGEGFPEFSAHFAGSDVPEDVQRKVLEFAQQNWYGIPNFPVRATDALGDLPIDDEDLEDAIIELARACGKEKPMLNVWKGQPILTVGDLARSIAHLPTPEEIRTEGIRRLWTDQ
jgi:hypothetical protein